MQIHDVHQGIHKYKKRKRVGRGTGSGHGKTASKGNKGHSSRQGFKQNALFEGGQMPLARRVPKRGFVNGAFRKTFAIINLSALTVFEAGSEVSEATLREKRLVKGRYDDGVKILGDGEVSHALHLRVAKCSQSAAAKIQAAGGTITLI